jgi:hypothetical protein
MGLISFADPQQGKRHVSKEEGRWHIPASPDYRGLSGRSIFRWRLVTILAKLKASAPIMHGPISSGDGLIVPLAPLIGSELYFSMLGIGLHSY